MVIEWKGGRGYTTDLTRKLTMDHYINKEYINNGDIGSLTFKTKPSYIIKN